MVSFILAPRWFIGIDLAIDLFSVITILLIALFTYKAYRLDPKKKYAIFTLAFTLLVISFLAKILSYTLIYYYPLLNLTRYTLIERIVDSSISGIRPSYILFSLSFSLFRLLHLLGLYLLYSIYERKVSKGDLLIIFTSFFLITYFSHYSYYAFHIVALLLLSIISYKYLRTYMKNKVFNTKLLSISFSIIAISQAVFIFELFHPLFYVYAEIIQLVGYVMLLSTFTMVIYNGKKTK